MLSKTFDAGTRVLRPAWRFLKRAIIASRRSLQGIVAVLVVCLPVLAVEAPHDFACMDCHMSHDVFGNQMGNTAGNANLCLSCHSPGASANRSSFTASDQAEPWPEYGTNNPGRGTSHRWDSQAPGRIAALGSAPSRALLLEGTYTGRYARAYLLEVTSPGSVGTARFNWWSEAPSRRGR